MIIKKLKHYIKDKVDGEFSRYKDALTINLERRDSENEDHVEVLDSTSFLRFGEKYLSEPGPRSGIKRRKFYDLKEITVKDRLAEKPGFKTLTGINSVFQYVCKPTGVVIWRILPCFCTSCANLQWDQCKCTSVVGTFKVVVKAGVEF